MNNSSNNSNNNNDNYIVTSITFTDTGAMFDNITSMNEDNTSGIQTNEEANEEANQTTLTQIWRNEKGSEDEKVRYPNINEL